MKFTTLALAITSAFGLTAFAQSSGSSGKPASSMPCMEGMAMPGCPQPDTHDSAPSKPRNEMYSMPGMQQTQHGMSGVQMGTSPQSQRPDTHATMTLQEPENPSQHTGSNLPAPELLKDVAARTPMALANFQELADANNPTLKQANALVRRSQEQARQAGLYPNPSVGYQGEQIRGGSYGGGEQGGFVQQTVVLGGKLGLRRNIYEQQKKSDQIGVEEQTYRVHADVQRAFYDALTAQATVQLRQRLLGVALDAVETVHQLANVGQADAPDILQTEVEAEQAKVDYATAQRQYLQAFHTLSALVGKGEMPVSPLQGELEKTPDLNAEQIVDSMIADSPTIKRAQQEAAVARARLKDAKRESVPDLQLRAGEQYNGERVGENPATAAGAQSFASAGINIPLWNRNQGNIGASKAEIERAEQDVARAQLSLRQQAAPLAQSYLSAQFEAERYKTQLIPRAARAYELYLKKYQDMAQAYPQVLVSQRTLFQLQISYIAALHDVWRSAIALQNYTLTGGLDSPMSSGSSTTTINLPNASGTQE
ncbi:MAG TPA: TolC family protein [Granulicella sp.]|jgi:cobalt-zinc-cadmium efflux system outer membrane protein|nr:TolC family protein [Granulicella sp.]